MKYFAVVLLAFSCWAGLPVNGATQVQFAGSPDPFASDDKGFGQITLNWYAPTASTVEIRVGSPTGRLFSRGGNHGSATTGRWVWNGLQFMLQDVSQGEPGKTLATYTAGSIFPDLPNGNVLVPTADGKKLIYSAPGATLLEIHVNSPSGPLFSRFGSSSGLVDLTSSASWMQNGQMFFLQDASNGHPLDYHYTRAATVIRPDPNAKPGLVFGAASNLLLDSQSAGKVAATLYWYAPGTNSVQIRLHAPDGALLAEGGTAGSAKTGDWVLDATEAYLQDASTGDPTSPANTLAKVILSLQQPVEHFVAPLLQNGFSSSYDRSSARFLNFLPVATPTYVSTPDGTQLLAVESQTIDVVDPASGKVTSRIALSTAPPPSASMDPVYVWMKGPQGQNWLAVRPMNVDVPYLYVVDPKGRRFLGTVPGPNTNDLIAFNPADNRVYFAVGRDLLSVDANLQVHSVASGLEINPSALTVVPIGASGSLLLHEDLQLAPNPYPTFSSKTLLFDIKTNTLTDVTPETPNLGSPDLGYAATKLVLSVDNRTVYTEGISVAQGGCQFSPCPALVGQRIVSYGFSAAVPFLRQRAEFSTDNQDVRIAGLDYRYVYLWRSLAPRGCTGTCGPQAEPPPSEVVPVDPMSLAVVGAVPLPGGPNIYGTKHPVSVVAGQYVLDLPNCGEWYCDARP